MYNYGNASKFVVVHTIPSISLSFNVFCVFCSFGYAILRDPIWNMIVLARGATVPY